MNLTIKKLYAKWLAPNTPREKPSEGMVIPEELVPAVEILAKTETVIRGKPVMLFGETNESFDAWCLYGIYKGFSTVEKTLIDWHSNESGAHYYLDACKKLGLHKDKYQELVLEKKKAVKHEDGTYTFS